MSDKSSRVSQNSSDEAEKVKSSSRPCVLVQGKLIFLGSIVDKLMLFSVVWALPPSLLRDCTGRHQLDYIQYKAKRVDGSPPSSATWATYPHSGTMTRSASSRLLIDDGSLELTNDRESLPRIKVQNLHDELAFTAAR